MADSNGNGISKNFTPTEQRVLAVLADGEPHDKRQLMAAIDELAEIATLRMHISNLRKKLRQRNETIHCVYRDRRYTYVHVRRLMPVE
jgi:DNA-binding response OmpR family regulator